LRYCDAFSSLRGFVLPNPFLARLSLLHTEVTEWFKSLHSVNSPISQSTTALSSSSTFACLCSHTLTISRALTALNHLYTPFAGSTVTASPTHKKTALSANANANSKKPLRHTQSDLSRYFDASVLGKSFGSSPGSGSGMGSTTNCGGTIKVTVEDDYSHALVVKGHRVIVEVLHWLGRGVGRRVGVGRDKVACRSRGLHSPFRIASFLIFHLMFYFHAPMALTSLHPKLGRYMPKSGLLTVNTSMDDLRVDLYIHLSSCKPNRYVHGGLIYCPSSLWSTRSWVRVRRQQFTRFEKQTNKRQDSDDVVWLVLLEEKYRWIFTDVKGDGIGLRLFI